MTAPRATPRADTVCPPANARRRALAASRAVALALAAASLVVWACAEQLPTATEEGLVPVGTTVEATLSFDEFATDARVYGGYGRPSDLGGGFVAREFGGADPPDGPGGGLNAATLVNFGDLPFVASVRDTTGTTRPDSSLTFLSGRIVAHFDADGSVAEGPVPVLAHEVTEPWDRVTATWSLAVDSLSRKMPWSAPGGGAVGPRIGRAVWDATSDDSLEIMVDSALVAAWRERRDSAGDLRSVRLTAGADGSRLKLRSVRFWIAAQPSLAPDTVVQVLAPTRGTTFIYDPGPPPATGAILRVGGAPAWRSVLDLDIPRRLTGPPELCAAVGCPVDIDEDHVSYAGLVLSPRRPAPAFAPSDTLAMDVRMVLAPSFLPKSPLGPSNGGIGGTGFAGTLLAPDLFDAPGTGETVEIPVTRLIRDLLRGETASGDPVPSTTVALLSTFEPVSIEYASFEGPGSPAAPRLRLILSFSPPDEG